MNVAKDMSTSLSAFFHSVTGKDILPYQEQYGADPFTPTLLNVPTGLGKTDAALLPWLHAHATGAPAQPASPSPSPGTTFIIRLPLTSELRTAS